MLRRFLGSKVRAFALAGGLIACGADHPSESASSVEADIIDGAFFPRLPAIAALVDGAGQECNATVFAPRRAVTAAHCCRGVNLSRYELVIGPRVDQATTRIHVAECRAHPQYRGDAEHDIGLVILSEDATVTPIPLGHAAMDASWVGRSLLVVGYGTTDHQGNGGYGVKRAAHIPILGVAPTTFRYGGGAPETCWGDSGGPALARGADDTLFVVGVTSWGDQYCQHFAVDARVDSFLAFLHAN
jgi:secreted trypsin-like serine protease